MASETVIISWNFTNWITVILMAFFGWIVYRTIAHFFNNRAGNEG